MCNFKTRNISVKKHAQFVFRFFERQNIPKSLRFCHQIREATKSKNFSSIAPGVVGLKGEGRKRKRLPSINEGLVLVYFCFVFFVANFINGNIMLLFFILIESNFKIHHSSLMEDCLKSSVILILSSNSLALQKF